MMLLHMHWVIAGKVDKSCIAWRDDQKSRKDVTIVKFLEHCVFEVDVISLYSPFT